MAQSLAAYAQQLDAPPQYEFGDRVRRHGRQAQPTYWHGRQWAVTEKGIERRDGTYSITADQCEGEELVQQMAAKDWVDLLDFAEALRVARRIRRDEMADQANER